MCRLKNQKGFTLIELMVVVSIIAILVAIALPRFTNARRAANTAKIAADLRTIDTAIGMFYVENNKYPVANPNLSASGLFDEDGKSKYFVSVPKPPSGEYYYSEDVNGVAKTYSTGPENYAVAAKTRLSDTERGVYRVANTTFATYEYFTEFKSISDIVIK